MTDKKQPVSLDAILNSDEPVFVGLPHPITGEPFLDEDEVECGFMVTSIKSDACQVVISDVEKASVKLKPGKRLSKYKQDKLSLNLLVAATVGVQGYFALEGEVVENTPESIRSAYKNSDVAFDVVNVKVGTKEAFTKGAMDQSVE